MNTERLKNNKNIIKFLKNNLYDNNDLYRMYVRWLVYIMPYYGYIEGISKEFKKLLNEFYPGWSNTTKHTLCFKKYFKQKKYIEIFLDHFNFYPKIESQRKYYNEFMNILYENEIISEEEYLMENI